MKALLFAKRNTKEILRDPINLFFGLGFPLLLLILLSVINANIPIEANNAMYAIENLAPGVAAFGNVFMAMFSGMLLAKDKTSSFLMRLFTSPMRSFDFILGYTLPMILISAAQSVITFSAALLLGLKFSANILVTLLVLIPNSFLFVGIGLLCGCLLSDKAVGGICGALLTNVAGWLSGVWFPLDLAGSAFKTAASFLPFYHGAEAAKLAAAGQFVSLLPNIAVVLGYAIVIYFLAVIVFKKKMKNSV